MKRLLSLILAAGAVLAQNAPRPPVQGVAPLKTQAQKDVERRLGLIATRATANFRSADSIEANLNESGLSLHPQIAALRLRIEAALEEAQKALDRGDAAGANEALDRAQALLQRYIQRLGGA